MTRSDHGRQVNAKCLQGSGPKLRGGSPAPVTSALQRRTAAVVIAVCLLLCGSAAAIEAALGDTVPLAGTAYGGQYVYLFLTGPNLPVNGVALDDVTSPADQGGLTRVPIGDNDRWEYDWDTHATGGRLDAGTYTVWVTTIPAGRSGLVSGEYRTLSVTLRSPGIAVAGPELSGVVSFTSNPPNASVMVDGQYLGTTPLSLRNLAPGTYNATLSRFGYYSRSFQVTVEGGATTEVSATLGPYSGSLTVASDPPNARVMVDGSDAGTAPVTFSDLTAGNHSLSAYREGYTMTPVTVIVIPGQDQNVTLLLVPVSGASRTAPAGSPVPVLLISTGAGLAVAALIRGRRR